MRSLDATQSEKRPAEPKAKKAPLLAKLAILAVSLVILFGGLELMVRLVCDQPQPLLVKDAVVGQRYRPGYHDRFYVHEAAREIELRFNRDGFRGPDYPVKKPAQVRRMAILGDSYVAGIAVDEGETMVRRLESLFNRHGSQHEGATHWETLNFGVSGNSTAQSLLTWREFASHYQPDVVVLCFYNGNDLSDNHPKLSSAHRPFFQLNHEGALELEPMSPAWTGASRWLSDHSRFYVWQKERMRGLRDRVRQWFGVAPPGLEIFDSSPTGVHEEAWQLTESLIATIGEEVRRAGASFVLVSIPCHEQIEDVLWDRLLACVGSDAKRYDRRYPERRLGEICSRHGILFVPLLASLQSRAQKDAVFLPNNGHWNATGQNVAAETIYHSLNAITQTAN